MSKQQFWILNVVGGVCALLLLINLVLGRLNEKSARTYTLKQNQLNRAQQMQQTIQSLAFRVAQEGRTDPALQAILVRHDLRVTLNDTKTATKAKP